MPSVDRRTRCRTMTAFEPILSNSVTAVLQVRTVSGMVALDRACGVLQHNLERGAWIQQVPILFSFLLFFPGSPNSETVGSGCSQLGHGTYISPPHSLPNSVRVLIIELARSTAGPHYEPW